MSFKGIFRATALVKGLQQPTTVNQDSDDLWLPHPWQVEPAPSSPLVIHIAGINAAALLTPLAAASAALARLDARLEAADQALAEGLRSRLALREAAGWLAHQHATWVHPTDLGLRAAGLTGSLTAAAMIGRLRAALPVTALAGLPDVVAEDRGVGQALQLGRLWQRLAIHRTWTPLAGATALRSLLAQLGCHDPAEGAMTDWLGRFASRSSASSTEIPALLQAGQAAQAWSEQNPTPGDRLATTALFLAACVWQRTGATPMLALPLWSAAPGKLETLGRATGPAWLAGFLDVVTDAAQRAGQELSRLQTAAARAATLRRTARSQLGSAAALALRLPVMTARGLADQLGLSPQAALTLIKQLVAAGVLREATGRASWRAFVVA